MFRKLDAVKAFQYRNTESSAKIIVPIITKIIKIKSVVDIGCGDGTWLSIFAKQGISNIVGVDANYVDKDRLRIPKDKFIIKDLTKTFEISQSFDLVVSLEVGEHLPKSSAKKYVHSLTQLGSAILFSAAIPFQGGFKHINEQWPNYWASLFQEEGYIVIDCLRNKIWDIESVLPWYSQNILFFVKKSSLKKYRNLKKDFNKNNQSPLSLVHPKVYLNKSITKTLQNKIKTNYYKLLNRKIK